MRKLQVVKTDASCRCATSRPIWRTSTDCGSRPNPISRVTDAVLDEVREWQHRALDRMYPIVIFDALRVKIRDADSRMVKNKAVYIALGVTRLKTKGSFPTEESATKLVFLAIRNFEKGGRAVREWVAARNHLAIMFAGRFDA